MAALGGGTHRIAEALDWLRRDFNQQLRIEEVARELGMSVSGFHHHFKEVTAMSPLQFQKQLRLQEARRLMLGEDLDAASAGYRVGYDDASHFSREYKRLFGAPPIQVVVGDEVHVSVLKALGMLGLGRRRVVRVPWEAFFWSWARRAAWR